MMDKVNLKEKYKVRLESIESGWGRLKVEVLCGEEVIYTYERNYGSFYSTFYPFHWKGREVAFIGPSYMGCELLDLQERVVIAKCDTQFCAVDFYVPDHQFIDWQRQWALEGIAKIDSGETKNLLRADNMAVAPGMTEREMHERELQRCDEFEANVRGRYAFMSGCYWGDDSGGWKLEVLDLSEVESGKITHVAPNPFGYLELAQFTNKPLSELISWDEPTFFQVDVSATFHLKRDKFQVTNRFFGGEHFPLEEQE